MAKPNYVEVELARLVKLIDSGKSMAAAIRDDFIKRRNILSLFLTKGEPRDEL